MTAPSALTITGSSGGGAAFGIGGGGRYRSAGIAVLRGRARCETAGAALEEAPLPGREIETGPPSGSTTG